MVEFSYEQELRNDRIYNAAYEFIRVLLNDPDAEWDMQLIGNITDSAAEYLSNIGHRIYYPAIITDDEGNQYVQEFFE